VETKIREVPQILLEMATRDRVSLSSYRVVAASMPAWPWLDASLCRDASLHQDSPRGGGGGGGGGGAPVDVVMRVGGNSSERMLGKYLAAIEFFSGLA
jgi:hypothetical protein